MPTNLKSDNSIPWRTVAALWLIYFFSASGRINVADSESMLALTRSLLHGSLTVPESVGHVLGADGRAYCHYGLLTSVWWLPFVLAGRGLAAVGPAIPVGMWEEFAVSFAGGIVMAALLAYLAWEWRRAGVNERRTRWGLWVMGLSTVLWPYAKISLSDPLLALSLFAAYGHWQRSGLRRHAWTAGLWLGAALLSRKQAQTIVPLLLLYFVWQPVLSGRARRLWWLALGLLPGVLIQFAYNQARWGNPFVERYAGAEAWTIPDPVEMSGRLAGLWMGNYSGFFIFNPGLLVVAACAAGLWWKQNPRQLGYVMALAATQTLFLAQLPFWQAPLTFGPRYLLFLVPFFALSWSHLPATISAGWRLALTISTILGLGIQILGVTTDSLAAAWRRDLYLRPDSWILTAHWGEFRRVTGIDRSAPPRDAPFAKRYWEHPAFHEPDLWWCHAWALYSQSTDARQQEIHSGKN